MTNTHRMLAALALAAAVSTTAGAAHADVPDGSGGQATDRSAHTVVQEGEDSLFGRAGEALASLTDLLDLNGGGQSG
ncbi:hypothetical protein SUDANB176_00404 [Streptomyces sp. enrichment culture]|uniref:hypothetical protein n=1 Tax=Streptomyces sp. enrichment culture TaxID=1795815 RepID=UPI003F572C8C